MIILNSKEIKKTVFPNNEIMIKIDDIKDAIDYRANIDRVIFKFENNEDILDLIFITKALKDLGRNIHLVITYMPYSRMDRTEGHTVFTLKYFADIINSLGFTKITVCEPHSDVTPALLNGRVEVVDLTKELFLMVKEELEFDGENDYILYPDNGAAKRYTKQIHFDKILVASKERDFKTGRITKMQINGDMPTKPFRAIILDDLCSFGGTFKMAAEELRRLGATEVHLIVSHCENSIHKGGLLKGDLIDTVYTTNSLLTDYNNDKLKIHSIYY